MPDVRGISGSLRDVSFNLSDRPRRRSPLKAISYRFAEGSSECGIETRSTPLVPREGCHSDSIEPETMAVLEKRTSNALGTD